MTDFFRHIQPSISFLCGYHGTAKIHAKFKKPEDKNRRDRSGQSPTPRAKDAVPAAAAKGNRNTTDLRLWSFYRSSATISEGDPRKDSILNTTELDGRMGTWLKESGKRSTTANIVFTSYPTLVAKRWVKATKSYYDPPTCSGHWQVDRIVLRPADSARREVDKAEEYHEALYVTRARRLEHAVDRGVGDSDGGL